MKNVVIVGSASLSSSVSYWLNRFKSMGYNVLDYPKNIDNNGFIELYPDIHMKFLTNIIKSDMVFVMNEDKNGISGYIGAESFAELAFSVDQKILYNKNIDIVLAKMPSEDNQCYDEIKLWLSLGWISIYEDKLSKSLYEQISNFTPHDIEEVKLKEYSLKWINSFSDVLTRDNEFGHFTSSSFVVNRERDKMLAIYHNIFDGYAYPGGHADGEEDLLGVALREVEEETGIKARILDSNIYTISANPVATHIKRGKYVPAHTHLDTLFIMEGNESDPLRIKEDENKDVRWIPLKDIDNYKMAEFAVPVVKKVIKRLENKGI